MIFKGRGKISISYPFFPLPFWDRWFAKTIKDLDKLLGKIHLGNSLTDGKRYIIEKHSCQHWIQSKRKVFRLSRKKIGRWRTWSTLHFRSIFDLFSSKTGQCSQGSHFCYSKVNPIQRRSTPLLEGQPTFCRCIKFGYNVFDSYSECWPNFPLPLTTNCKIFPLYLWRKLCFLSR